MDQRLWFLQNDEKVQWAFEIEKKKKIHFFVYLSFFLRWNIYLKQFRALIEILNLLNYVKKFNECSALKWQKFNFIISSNISIEKSFPALMTILNL